MVVAVDAQTNIMASPNKMIRITWDTSPDAVEYGIFFSQATDPAMFPFQDGTDGESLWIDNEPVDGFMFMRGYTNYYGHQPNPVADPNVTEYVRIGIAPIDPFTGEIGIIRTLPYDIAIKKPTPVNNVREY